MGAYTKTSFDHIYDAATADWNAEIAAAYVAMTNGDHRPDTIWRALRHAKTRLIVGPLVNISQRGDALYLAFKAYTAMDEARKAERPDLHAAAQTRCIDAIKLSVKLRAAICPRTRTDPPIPKKRPLHCASSVEKTITIRFGARPRRRRPVYPQFAQEARDPRSRLEAATP